MSAEVDAEEGRRSGLPENLRWQSTLGFLRRNLQRTFSVFGGAYGTIAGTEDVEPSLRADGVEVAEDLGFAPKRLSVEKISQLVGHDVGCLSLQVAVSNDGSSPEVEWTHSNITLLISRCGPGVINPVHSGEMSLIHVSIVCNAIDCSEDLFAYALTKKVPVVLEWAEADILGWALKSRKTSMVEYVLNKILGKISTPLESARLIRKHFDTLLEKFPCIVQKLMETDSFCFEYGRFQVPAEIFEWRAPLNVFKLRRKYSTAIHSTAAIPWKAADDKEVEKFWVREDAAFAEKIETSAGEEVTVVSKFICINCPFHTQPKTVLSHLISSKCPVDAFKSRTVKTMTQWRWQISSRSKHIALLVIHLVLAILFFLFAASSNGNALLYYYYSEHYQDPKDGFWDAAAYSLRKMGKSTVHLGRSLLLFCFTLACFALFVVFEPLLVPYTANVGYICFRIIPRMFPPKDAVVMTAIQCLLILISIVQALRPFRQTGPFVSMLYYTLWDIIPFLLLGVVSITSFGIALFVSVAGYYTENWYRYHHYYYDDDDRDDRFVTVQKAFQYLFYPMLGTFDNEAEVAGNGSLGGLRRIFIYVFALLGGVVLLSLLIAALGDTFDRVTLTREAESVKSRATAVERRGFSSLYWGLSRLPFLRCFWKRPSQWFDEDMSREWLFDCLLLGWRRLMRTRQRKCQLQKLQDFADSTINAVQGQCEAAEDVLIFHFLVPVDSDTDSAKRLTWHGRILALVKIIEKAFEKACESIDRHSGETKQSLENAKKEIEAVKRRVEETEERLTEQLGAMQDQIERNESAMQTRMESIETNQRSQLDATKARMESLEIAIQAMQAQMERIENNQQMQFEAVLRKLNEM